MQENTYENECSPYHIYIYENDKYNYSVGDLIHTTNIPLETVEKIDKDLSTQKGYEWHIMVENNENQYKPCEIHGKVIATSDPELATKYGLDLLDSEHLKTYAYNQGNVDVDDFFSEYSLIPNDFSNHNGSILTLDKSERFEITREEDDKLNKSDITLGWCDESKGYDIILKNKYGQEGRVYTYEDIEQIREEAFLEGKSSVEFE